MSISTARESGEAHGTRHASRSESLGQASASLNPHMFAVTHLCCFSSHRSEAHQWSIASFFGTDETCDSTNTETASELPGVALTWGVVGYSGGFLFTAGLLFGVCIIELLGPVQILDLAPFSWLSNTSIRVAIAEVRHVSNGCKAPDRESEAGVRCRLGKLFPLEAISPANRAASAGPTCG